MLDVIFKLVSSSYLGAALVFIVQVITANYMTVEDYGQLSAVLTLIAMLVPLVGFGMEHYIYKFNSDFNSNFACIYKPLAAYFLITLAVASLAYIYLSNSSEFIFLIFMLVSQFTLSMSLALLQINRSYNFFSLMSVMQGFIRVLVVLLFIYVNGELNINLAIIAYFISSVVVFVISFLVIKAELCKVEFKPSYKNISLLALFKKSAPFGVGTVSFLLYSQGVVYFLNVFGSSEDAAYYSVANTFMIMVLLIPTVIFQKFLIPKLHILVKSKVDLKYLYTFGNFLMLFLGVFVSVSLYYFSAIIVPWVFGDNFYASVEVLKALSLVVLFRFFSANSAAYLVTENYMLVKNAMMLTVGVLSALLMIIFVPKYGLDGAIYVTLLCEFAICFAYVSYVKIKIFGYIRLTGILTRDYKNALGLIK